MNDPDVERIWITKKPFKNQEITSKHVAKLELELYSKELYTKRPATSRYGCFQK